MVVGSSVILYRAVNIALASYRELGSWKVTLGVVAFYPLWALINGLSVLSELFRFAFTK